MKILYVIFTLLMVPAILIAQRPPADTITAQGGNIIIQPISHATFVLQYNNTTIYVDPTGRTEAFAGLPVPDIILLTDIHGDHLQLETLKAIDTKHAKFVVPPAVAEIIEKDFEKQLEIMKNGSISLIDDILINAIPMYNLPEDKDSYHPKGRGNGYYLKMGGKNIYISGDTEDIIEMRELKGIDFAFICMNLPYTMTIEQAANAVLDFKPKIVYPYHYRGKPDISDVAAFKKLVNDKNPNIDVRLRDWYPQ